MRIRRSEVYFRLYKIISFFVSLNGKPERRNAVVRTCTGKLMNSSGLSLPSIIPACLLPTQSCPISLLFQFSLLLLGNYFFPCAPPHGSPWAPPSPSPGLHCLLVVVSIHVIIILSSLSFYFTSQIGIEHLLCVRQ